MGIESSSAGPCSPQASASGSPPPRPQCIVWLSTQSHCTAALPPTPAPHFQVPDTKFEGLAMRFMDIRKRVYELPTGARNSTMVCIPTTSGTGSEVTPFSVVTGESDQLPGKGWGWGWGTGKRGAGCP